MDDKTVDHYGYQWGKAVGFCSFVDKNPHAMQATPSRQLPWADLFARIRERAAVRRTRVYDAGCGFGDAMRQLVVEPTPPHLEYLGTDIQSSLDDVPLPRSGRVIRHDMTQTLEGEESFDFVICRSAMHHTSQPRETFKTLAGQIAPEGTIAVSLGDSKALNL